MYLTSFIQTPMNTHLTDKNITLHRFYVVSASFTPSSGTLIPKFVKLTKI